MKKFSIVHQTYQTLFSIWLVDCAVFVILILYFNEISIYQISLIPGIYQYLYWFTLWSIVMNGIWAFFAGIYKLRHPKPKANQIKNHESKISAWSYCILVFTISVFMLFVSQDINTRDVQYFVVLRPYSESITLLSFVFILTTFVLGIISYITAIVLPKDDIREEPIERDNFSRGNTSLHNQSLEDVLFIPKKRTKNLNIVVYILIGLLAVVGFLYLVNQSDEISTQDFDEESNSTSIEENVDLTNYLKVENISSTYNRDSVQVKGTVRNFSVSHAKDIILRVDFFSSKEGTQPFDTRFIKLDYVAGNGAYTFNEIVNLNYDKEYWFNVKIESAMKL